MAASLEAPMDLSLCELCAAIQSGQLSPVDSVDAALARIERLNPAVNAFVFVCAAEARAEAAQQAELLSRDKSSLGPLAGVPFGVKDLEDVKGLPTSYGAAPLKDNIAVQDSVVVERLRAAGAIVVGKTNTPLFGSTAYCKNLLYGVTRNPWNLLKTPGGSSGGSSAAIAARMVPLATAADGGGSIRIPATYVGAFGLKPSFGRVPMTEGEQFGMTKWVDCVHFGPLTRTVADAALFLDMTVGYSPRDPNSLPHPGISYAETTALAASTNTIPALAMPRGGSASAGTAPGVGVSSLRVGWSATLGYISATDPAVLEACEASLAVFRELGCTVVNLDLALIDLGRDWGAAMGAQEYAMVHEELEETKEQLERGFVAGWARSATTNTDHFAKIYRKLHTLNEGLAAVFEEVDVLITPALPTVRRTRASADRAASHPPT
jgi:Asp-tRNA(Asn)/Glu-tRNA(Gln) amidotransferase A subunit family amidase|eukprot:COSAG06_NODE_352_length_16924_cov_168.566615_16_plen_436_part_00